MSISIDPRRLLRISIAIAAGLTIISASLGLFSVYTGHGRLLGISRIFNVGAEANIPTWYSSFGLLLCSVCLWVISRSKTAQHAPYALQWRLLSFGFLYLSIDEASTLHETFGNILDHFLNGNSLMHYGWVLPAAGVILVLSPYFVKFISSLSTGIRRLFIISTILYLGGALGLEAIGGSWRTVHGENNAAYILMMNTEEMAEMLGLAFFLYTFTSYMSRHTDSIFIQVASPGVTSSARKREDQEVGVGA